mmetsp:Transcript_152100/g.283397  ORF Transcript_152100/g.283397 Transcript_152100/m.283397 type:complete len:292 (-) Transcript_152100:27-902(-)
MSAWSRLVACLTVISSLLPLAAEGADELPDPEELPGGEMHLGAVNAPTLEMLSVPEMRSLYRRVDADGDGAMSLQEMLEFSARLEAKMDASQFSVSELDSSKDGKLSLDEVLQDNPDLNDFFGLQLQAQPQEAEMALRRLVFSSADQDADGLLSEGELDLFFSPSNLHKALSETSLRKKDKDGNQRLTILEFFTEPGSEYIVESEEELSRQDIISFRELDRDSSDDLDVEELQVWESGHFATKAELQQLMAAADADQNGDVSVEEFVAAREQIDGSNAMFHLLEWHLREEL